MDDGSCNHMTCAVCAAEFCWLCMKEISDLHYLRYDFSLKKNSMILELFLIIIIRERSREIYKRGGWEERTGGNKFPSNLIAQNIMFLFDIDLIKLYRLCQNH